MAKRFFGLGILVIMLVFGMMVVGCDIEPKECSGDGNCTACSGTGVRTVGYSATATVEPGGYYIGHWDNMSWYRYPGQNCTKCKGNGKCPICNGDGC